MDKLLEPKMYLEDIEGAWHVDETHLFCPNCEFDIPFIEHNIDNAYGFRITCPKCKSKYDFRLVKVDETNENKSYI